MGYSLCKMPSLGAKLKFSRKKIKVVMCKTQLQKTPKNLKNDMFLKIDKIGQNIKNMLETLLEEKRLQKQIWVVRRKKRLQKTPNLRKFSNIAKIGHNAWPIAFPKCSVYVKN